MEVLHGAEEHRADDLVNQRLRRQLGQAEIGQLERQGARRDRLRFSGLRHSAQELQNREDHANIDGNDQVREHSQQERNQQDDPIGNGRFAQHADEPPGLAHVPGDDEQDRGQGCQRDACGEGGKEQ